MQCLNVRRNLLIELPVGKCTKMAGVRDKVSMSIKVQSLDFLSFGLLNTQEGITTCLFSPKH